MNHGGWRSFCCWVQDRLWWSTSWNTKTKKTYFVLLRSKSTLIKLKRTMNLKTGIFLRKKLFDMTRDLRRTYYVVLLWNFCNEIQWDEMTLRRKFNSACLISNRPSRLAYIAAFPHPASTVCTERPSQHVYLALTCRWTLVVITCVYNVPSLGKGSITQVTEIVR